MQITCTACGKLSEAKETKGNNARTPRGWKKTGENLFCPACKDSKYILRAITFPVASVIDGEWKDFCQALQKSWGRSTRLANWAMRQLIMADKERDSKEDKQAKMPVVNLYKLWQKNYEREEWAGGAASANTILQSTDRKYRKIRYKLLWLYDQSVPHFKFPVPYPVHNQGWQAEYKEIQGKDGQTTRIPTVSCVIDGKRWSIKLRGGPELKRQLAAFSQIVSGGAIKGELAIYRNRSANPHRRGGEEKAAGGGQKFKTRIMIKLVAFLPRENKEVVRAGSLEVRTARNCLLVAVAPQRKDPWLFHANQMRHWIRVYQWQRQNMADDSKATMRPISQAKRDRYTKLSNKHDNRMSTFCHQTAAALVDFAVRCKVSTLAYNETDKRYVDEFPWYKLCNLIKEKCNANGLKFELRGDDVKIENVEEISTANEITEGYEQNKKTSPLAENVK